MTTLSKTLIAAAALAAMATTAFSQVPLGVQPRHGLHVWRPRQDDRRWPWHPDPEDQLNAKLTKNATKVPSNTVFFMNGGELHSCLGYARPDRQFLSAVILVEMTRLVRPRAARAGK